MIFMPRPCGRMTESKTAVGGQIEYDRNLKGGKKWNFWAVALEKLYKTNEARNLSLFFYSRGQLVASLVSLSLQLFWNFLTFACLVCVTNFAALGWRFKCVSHLAWLHFNSRRVQLGGLSRERVWERENWHWHQCNCFLYVYMVWESVLFITFAFAAVFFLH